MVFAVLSGKMACELVLKLLLGDVWELLVGEELCKLAPSTGT
jgi:hypothetical protein